MTDTPPPPPPTPPAPPPPPTPPSGYSADAPTAAAGPYPGGTTILVLGILSLFICGIIFGIIAWVQGTNALKAIDASPGRYTNRGTVNAGRILGAIGFLLNIIGVVIAIAVAAA